MLLNLKTFSAMIVCKLGAGIEDIDSVPVDRVENDCDDMINDDMNDYDNGALVHIKQDNDGDCIIDDTNGYNNESKQRQLRCVMARVQY